MQDWVLKLNTVLETLASCGLFTSVQSRPATNSLHRLSNVFQRTSIIIEASVSVSEGDARSWVKSSNVLSIVAMDSLFSMRFHNSNVEIVEYGETDLEPYAQHIHPKPKVDAMYAEYPYDTSQAGGKIVEG